MNRRVHQIRQAHFCNAYLGETISKEDIFYYVYGLLYSEDYRTRYADNLMKELPRIPCVKTATFRHFSEAGRQLAKLHLNYETVTPYPFQIDGVNLFSKPEVCRASKMRNGGKAGMVQVLMTMLLRESLRRKWNVESLAYRQPWRATGIC